MAGLHIDKMFAVYAFFILISCKATQAVPLQYQENASSSISYSDYFNDLRYLYKFYQQCTYQDIVSCLKQKLATTMDRLVKNQVRVPLLDGVYFVKSTDNDSDGRNTREARSQRALKASDLSLSSMFTNGIYDFLKTHILEVSLLRMTVVCFGHLQLIPSRKSIDGLVFCI